MAHPESDGAAEMLEGGHRAISTAAMRLAELYAQRLQIPWPDFENNRPEALPTSTCATPPSPTPPPRPSTTVPGRTPPDELGEKRAKGGQ